jgi:hypothetical protein
MLRVSLACLVVSLSLAPAFAQQSSASLIAPELLPGGGAPVRAALGGGTMAPPSASRPVAFSQFAIGAKVGLLGAGVEAAVPLSYHLNLRAGGNFLSYNDTLTSDGITYNADLKFRSAETSVDWFPWARSFHISPGALVYNGNRITGGASVPAGQTFTLNNTTYTSSSTDPVTGYGSLTLRKTAPKLTVGWGNLIPRNGRHLSVPFEIGAAYVGDPKVALSFSGTACSVDAGVSNCSNVATDPTTQANVAAEERKIAKDADDARFFPLLSVGFAYRF